MTLNAIIIYSQVACCCPLGTKAQSGSWVFPHQRLDLFAVSTPEAPKAQRGLHCNNCDLGHFLPRLKVQHSFCTVHIAERLQDLCRACTYFCAVSLRHHLSVKLKTLSEMNQSIEESINIKTRTQGPELLNDSNNATSCHFGFVVLGLKAKACRRARVATAEHS